MVKPFFPALTTHSTAIVSSIRSKRAPLILLIPVTCYFLFRLFETGLTHFIIPLFPDEADKSYGFYNDFLHLCFNEVLWFSFFMLIGWIMLIYVPLERVISKIQNHIITRKSIYLAGIYAVSCISALLIAYHSLEVFPNSADEYVYLYQAETLSQGKLTQQAHPLEFFFHFNHIVQRDGVAVGRFPPGWPLLLSIPYLLGFPAYWLNPILGTIALLVFYRFTERYYGERAAIWSLLTMAFTSYYVFNGASYFSHTSCLLFIIAFVYCLRLSREKGSDIYALISGVFLGLIVITRYYTAVLIFIPVLVSLVYYERWNVIRPLFFTALGILPSFAFLCWYNYEITGNPLLPVTVWADPDETIGFVKGHTFLKGAEHFVRRLFLFMYWSSPAILILYFIYLGGKMYNTVQRFVYPEDYFLLMLFIGYFFYHHPGGNQYGPRFLFEAFPFAIVLVVSRALQAKVKWPLALLAAGMIYGIVKIPYIIQRESQVVHERMDVYKKVKEAGISNAVVLLTTHTGVIRPMPIRDLTRNDMNYQQSVIYAQDQREKNHLLMEFYPDRSFYKYVRDREKVEGWLMKLK